MNCTYMHRGVLVCSDGTIMKYWLMVEYYRLQYESIIYGHSTLTVRYDNPIANVSSSIIRMLNENV